MRIYKIVRFFFKDLPVGIGQPNFYHSSVVCFQTSKTKNCTENLHYIPISFLHSEGLVVMVNNLKIFILEKKNSVCVNNKEKKDS